MFCYPDLESEGHMKLEQRYKELLASNSKYWSGTCLLCGLNRIDCQRRLDEENGETDVEFLKKLGNL